MCERELETNEYCNILTSPAPRNIAVCLSRSPGLLNRGPGAQLSAESLFSLFDLDHCLKLQLLNRGSRGPPLLGAVLSTASYFQLTRTSCAPSYIIVLRPLNLLPTEYATSAVFGMACFDHHRAEITVMQFTGHPLPVHQFVTVQWDFNPAPYCQPSSPTQSLRITGQRNMQLPPSLEWHVFPGRRSIYNTYTLCQ